MPDWLVALNDIPALLKSGTTGLLGVVVMTVQPAPSFFRLSPESILRLRQQITDDLAADLKLMNRTPHLDDAALDVVSDLVVKTVFATLPELIDPPAEGLPAHLTPEAKMTQQLRFIFIGAKHWRGLGQGRD